MSPSGSSAIVPTYQGPAAFVVRTGKTPSRFARDDNRIARGSGLLQAYLAFTGEVSEVEDLPLSGRCGGEAGNAGIDPAVENADQTPRPS